MNLAPPSSQKAEVRPIAFILDDRAVSGPMVDVDLAIRPEDLTKSDTSRLAVQQTLGSSVWADNFGPGLPMITLSGHTGWRRSERGFGSGNDGIARFQQLHDTIFTAWHDRRRRAVQAGSNPDGVRLIFADSLDSYSAVVAPMNFTLRRSRTRPLLAQFQISMTVLSNDLGLTGFMRNVPSYLTRSLTNLGDAGVLQSLGLDSLTASINKISGLAHDVQKYLTTTIGQPLGVFMNQTARLYGAVRGAISAVSGIAGTLIGIAQTTAAAGVNIFRSLAAIANIPNIAKNLLMQVAGAYLNILCVLKNALSKETFFQDYSDVYGSSNCSSTSGGRPMSTLAGENPFYRVVPTREPLPISMTAPAQASLNSLSNMDPVLAPMNSAVLGDNLRSVSTGMVVA